MLVIMALLTVMHRMAANHTVFHMFLEVARAMWALSRHARNVLKRAVNGNIGKNALLGQFEDLQGGF